MLGRTSWAVLLVAARPRPVSSVFRAARAAVPRSFAKLPTAAIKPPIGVDQPELLLELAAATDGTTARKLLNSDRTGIVRLRRDPSFVRTLVAFRHLHGLQNTQLVSLCIRASVASRLGSPEFDDALKALRDEYSMDTAQLVTFVCDGAAKRLGSSGFDDALKALRDEYSMDTAQLVTFMCDGVANRLGSPEFDDALKALRDEYSMDTAQLVAFVTAGVAAKLGTREFVNGMKALQDEYSMDTAQLVTFMCGGVAARLGTPEFHDALKALRDKYSLDTEQLASVMQNSVAKRLHDEQFQSALGKVIACAGVPCCITLFSRGSFSSRIVDVVDDFCALVEHCRLNGSNAEAVVTLLGNGKLLTVVPQLRRQLCNVHGNDLHNAMAKFYGSYAHKNKKAKELMLSRALQR